MYKNSQTSYGSVAMFFHWLIFFLVFFMLFLGYFMGDVSGDAKGSVFNLHKLMGLSILILMILRTGWALINIKPVIPSSAVWERFLAHLMHIVLYLLLIAMPLAGWLMSSYAGKPPHIFNWMIKLPVQNNKAQAELFVTIHNTLAIVIIVCVSLHILAALHHHFIKKDNVLKRMTPGM